jgi:hypothetical protein
VLVNTVRAHETEISRIVDARFSRRPSLRLCIAPSALLRCPRDGVAVPMESLLSDGGAIVPAFRPASRFHHDAVYQPFSAVLPYERFLRLEENTAAVVVACLHDPRPVRYIFFWQDGCWLSESSLVSYLTSEERRCVFRMLSAETGATEPVAAPDARVWFFPGGAGI